MSQQLKHRKATIDDLGKIVELLLEDELGQTREHLDIELDQHYIDAFHKIDTDPNQYLLVVILGSKIVGTCHLTYYAFFDF